MKLGMEAKPGPRAAARGLFLCLLLRCDFVRGRLEQRSRRRGQLARSRRASGGVAVPPMPADAFQDPRRQRDGIAAILAADARPRAGADTLQEMLQLAAQLIAAVAVQVQGLDMSAE